MAEYATDVLNSFKYYGMVLSQPFHLKTCQDWSGEMLFRQVVMDSRVACCSILEVELAEPKVESADDLLVPPMNYL
jgi:hypothetical protein